MVAVGVGVRAGVDVASGVVVSSCVGTYVDGIVPRGIGDRGIGVQNRVGVGPGVGVHTGSCQHGENGSFGSHRTGHIAGVPAGVPNGVGVPGGAKTGVGVGVAVWARTAEAEKNAIAAKIAIAINGE